MQLPLKGNIHLIFNNLRLFFIFYFVYISMTKITFNQKLLK